METSFALLVLCGEPHRWIPSQRASDSELILFGVLPERALEQDVTRDLLHLNAHSTSDAKETRPSLLALSVEVPPVTGGFPSRRTNNMQLQRHLWYKLADHTMDWIFVAYVRFETMTILWTGWAAATLHSSWCCSQSSYLPSSTLENPSTAGFPHDSQRTMRSTPTRSAGSPTRITCQSRNRYGKTRLRNDTRKTQSRV